MTVSEVDFYRCGTFAFAKLETMSPCIHAPQPSLFHICRAMLDMVHDQCSAIAIDSC